MRRLLLALLLLLPGSVWAQATLSGTVRDSLTHQPLPFASVFLANTTLGITTNERGEFRLAAVPPGSYDLVASYVGYRLGRQAVRVSGTVPPLVLELAPEASRLGEVVVRGRVRANRPEDYRRFVELFLGRTSFSQQCRILNPRAVRVSYDAKANELVASAADYVQVENLALGYRLKFYGLRFKASFAQQVVTFYGQPVFEDLASRSRHQRWRWEINRLAAYHGSQTHFLKAVYDNQVVAEGFLVQKLRIVANPPYARADSLRQRLLHRQPATAYTPAERDSLAAWAKVLPSLMLLHTKPRPIDSLRRVAADGRVFLRFNNYLQVKYLQEPPDVLYIPSEATLVASFREARQQVSWLHLLAPEAELQPNGHLVSPLAVFSEQYWSFEKMGEFLPLDYAPPTPTPK